MHAKDKTLRFEEVEVPSGSGVCGKTLGELEIPQKTGLIVVAVRESEEGKYLYNPHSSLKIGELDVLVVLGEIRDVESLKRMIGGR